MTKTELLDKHKEDIEGCLRQGLSYRKIGKLYGTSHVTVAKWINDNGLEQNKETNTETYNPNKGLNIDEEYQAIRQAALNGAMTTCDASKLRQFFEVISKIDQRTNAQAASDKTRKEYREMSMEDRLERIIQVLTTTVKFMKMKNRRGQASDSSTPLACDGFNLIELQKEENRDEVFLRKQVQLILGNQIPSGLMA